MLDPHRLTILRSVIAAGSVHAAARSLHLAPATVSQHLQGLARQTGLVLFEKSGRGIEPTPAARHLADASEDALVSLEQLGRTVTDLREGRAERIAIACFASVAQAWMPHVVRALHAASPGVVVEMSSNELNPAGGRQRSDVDVRNEAVAGTGIQQEGYRRHVLAEEEFCVVLPADHPLASGSAVTLSELSDQPWIDHDMHDGPTGQIIARACQSAGFIPRYVARLDDHHAAISLAAAGLGITVLPRMAIVGLSEGLVVRPLADPPVHRRIVAHARMHPPRARLIQVVLDALREAAHA
ncbi:DNA-binding transcriptional LysR family regulator [Arthrobacter pigmenti]|uniref:DNA-binding transcriptional LysR family regulator n=1 Tax=Arthrobacter pigmenti TaxID=271432 RepID=A0A846RTV3_9MICC|nr:LysR family transcriptional regulator [Arthrobacter pigmenti]NJC23954.1 DNA-binding transcriptional LysR family regulator [Arthrobacter pigmenti]